MNRALMCGGPGRQQVRPPWREGNSAARRTRWWCMPPPFVPFLWNRAAPAEMPAEI